MAPSPGNGKVMGPILDTYLITLTVGISINLQKY